tara:strand:- start:339 stop:2465 length:2127 start_codon:yes stop_codon:yes gene_type:complete
MAEYQDRSGYNPGVVGSASGSEPPDTIEAQWIRKLERDLWVRFWGPGPVCADWDSNTEYERAMGWNQSASYDAGTSGSGTTAAGMGDLSGNPESHIDAGTNPDLISTSDPRDAVGYGKYTVRANITDATNTTPPCRITCIGHGLLHDPTSSTPHEDSTLSVPNKIQIVGVPATSMHELNCDNVNNQFFYAKVIDNDTLDLFTDAGFTTEYDSSSNTPWAGTEGYVNFVVDFVEGEGDAGNYERTTTIARDQYIALQQRVNAAIKRTGVSTFATGDSKKTLDLVQHQYGSMYKSDGTLTADINEDMGRIRDDHVNDLSAEIELIGAPFNITSLGSYHFHRLHVHGIYAPYSMNNDDDLVYSDNNDQAYGTWSNAWGSDNWSAGGSWDPSGHNIPWSSSGGSNHGNDRPFIEARMTFLDWDHLRYWFNQGGCCIFWPDFQGDGSMGGWLWQNLARANNPSGTSKVFAGQYAPYHENAALISTGSIAFHQGGSGNGWGVTADAPRVHAIGDQANAYFAGTGGSTGNGITITVSSTTNMATGDILHLGEWIGEIETIIDSSTAHLYQIIRQINGTVYDPDPTNGDGPLSGQAWACSKWYRACQYDGGGGLYGDNSPGFPNDESTPGDGGYIHYDWRFVKDPNQSDKPCIFYRMMYDNTGNHCTVHGVGTVRLGSRWPDAIDYFFPEQGANPVVTNDKASTSELHDGLNRVND